MRLLISLAIGCMWVIHLRLKLGLLWFGSIMLARLSVVDLVAGLLTLAMMAIAFALAYVLWIER